MRKTIIDLLHRANLYNFAHRAFYGGKARLWRLYGDMTGRNENLLRKHKASGRPVKLHLGCGYNILPGWINTDFRPNKNCIFLDITGRYSFEDNSFDYIFTEHVIEHVPYASGKNMIHEAFRVLKPGGTLRLVTPDIRFLIGLYQEEQKPLHQDYIKWNSGLFVAGKAPHTALSVINNYVRDWGHQYIYDVPTLTSEMQSCGFIDIKTPKLMESEHDALRGLEHEHRHPPGFLALESLIIEATKPL